MASFNYDLETNEGILPKSAHSISSGAASIYGVEPRKNIFNDAYTVIDGKRAPPNAAEKIEKSLVKVNRMLRGKYATKDAFEKQLKERAGADPNNNLNMDDFKAFVVESCREDLIARRVSKQEIEGFLSAFVFNAHGATDVNAVAPLVYE